MLNYMADQGREQILRQKLIEAQTANSLSQTNRRNQQNQQEQVRMLIDSSKTQNDQLNIILKQAAGKLKILEEKLPGLPEESKEKQRKLISESKNNIFKIFEAGVKSLANARNLSAAQARASGSVLYATAAQEIESMISGTATDLDAILGTGMTAKEGQTIKYESKVEGEKTRAKEEAKFDLFLSRAGITDAAERKKAASRFFLRHEVDKTFTGGKLYLDLLSADMQKGADLLTTVMNLEAMADIVGQEDFEAGIVPNALTNLQNIASGLGLEEGFTTILEELGIKVGDVAKKQNFNRIFAQLAIESFKFFKGNLNTAEVKLARDSLPKPGDTTISVLDGLATMMAMQEIAQERALTASTMMEAFERRDTAALGAWYADRVKGDASNMREKIRKNKQELVNRRAGRTATREAGAEPVPPYVMAIFNSTDTALKDQTYRNDPIFKAYVDKRMVEKGINVNPTQVPE
tara:strand:- start:1263 stop:2657 length:1395 start_codon:yes stop_codon:yes gene_type:complete